MKSLPMTLAAPRPRPRQLEAAREDARLEAALVASRNRLFRGAMFLLGSRDDAEDLTQRALLKAWQSRGGFRGNSEPYTWLYRILLNLCKDHFKARARADRWLEEFTPVAREAAVERPATERLLREERDEQVRAGDRAAERGAPADPGAAALRGDVLRADGGDPRVSHRDRAIAPGGGARAPAA